MRLRHSLAGAALAALLAAAPASAQELKEYAIKLTAAEINVIGIALGQRPYNEVNALLKKIQAQIDEQNAGPKPVPIKPEPPQ